MQYKPARPVTTTLVLTVFFLALAGAGWFEGALLAERLSNLSMASPVASKAVAVFAVIAFAMVLVRTGLWLMYRPVEAQADADLPTVTVVIPAYHEGAGVRIAIESALASDYPADKLEIICVDDGSRDDTFAHVTAACAEDERAHAIRLDRNQGKRHALYAGFMQAKGDVIVTLDSDSQMTPDTLRNLVAPLEDERIGGVAGRVLVRNREENALTRMLWVQYVIGFDFTRAYQSVLGNVFCVPGACAAYRKSVVQDHWIAWRDQTFLGASCNNGDDHHMTTMVLRHGHDVVYQSTATIFTQVPSDYRRLSRMFTRWARSNIRESSVYMTFAVGRARRTGNVLSLIDGAFKVVTNVLRPIGFFALFALLALDPVGLLGLFGAVVAAGVMYSAYYLKYERSHAVLYGVAYAVYSFIALGWIYPYAFATVRQNVWLTR